MDLGLGVDLGLGLIIPRVIPRVRVRLNIFTNNCCGRQPHVAVWQNITINLAVTLTIHHKLFA